MRKRILSILLTLCMALCLAPMAAFAADETVSISSAQELKAFAQRVNNGETALNAKLTADIVLNGGTFDEDGNWSESGTPDQWTPIGGVDRPYTGTFDGGCHTIKGLYINNGGEYVGLFCKTKGATIQNVAVTGFLKGYYYAGGIVARACGYATISNCVNMCRVISTGAKDLYSCAGGIAGLIGAKFDSGEPMGGSVTNCANLGRVSAANVENGLSGGIAGSARQVAFTGCYNVGIVEGGTRCSNLSGAAENASSFDRCYWLKAEDHADGAVSYLGESTIQNSEGKTKTELANELLPLLQNGDANSPWTKTGYLAAAGMTLPLLSWQTADTHTCAYNVQNCDNTHHWTECACGVMEPGSKAEHSEVTGICTEGIKCECGYEMHPATSGHNWGEWQHLATSHTRRCDNPGCGMTQSRNCSGGTATCTEQATCEVCGGKYGSKDPNNHSYEWTSENGEYWQHCTRCGLDLDKKAVPEIVINGADRVCRTQDYTFSFTLPEGATDAAYGYEFIGLADGPLTPTVEDNLYSGILKATIYPAEDNSFKLIVSAKTADDFEFSAEKTVTILNEHTGGTATCTDKAVCEVCGESYGELNARNHSDLKHFDAKAATETAEGNIEYWFCEDCGRYFADKEQTKEITQADTVTAKLPATPKTGDESSPVLWMTLLVISGGAAILCRRRRAEK